MFLLFFDEDDGVRGFANDISCNITSNTVPDLVSFKILKIKLGLFSVYVIENLKGFGCQSKFSLYIIYLLKRIFTSKNISYRRRLSLISR